MAIIVTFCAGLSVLIGVIITNVTRKSSHVELIEHGSMALALGALMALMFFDMIPEIAEKEQVIGVPAIVVSVLAGFGILKLLDQFIPDHDDNEQNHDLENATHIGIMASMAVILHNLIEGMTVYSLTLADPKQGVIFAASIALHNIPMGMLIYTTVNSRHRCEKTLLIGLVTVSTLAGGLMMYGVSGLLTGQLIGVLLCMAVGMIIYIVFAELLPHVIKTRQPAMSVAAGLIGFIAVLLSCSIGG